MRLSAVGIFAVAPLAALLACGDNPPPATADSGTTDVGGYVFAGSDPVQPLAGIFVRLGGTQAVTDANGFFTIPAAPSSYDLLVEDVPARAFTSFVGLTRRDPHLQIASSLPPDVWSAHVTVTSALASPGQRVVLVATDPTQGAALMSATPDGKGGATVAWAGPYSFTADMNALVFQTDAMGSPVKYVGFGWQSVSLANGQDAVSSIELSPPVTGNLAISTTLPQGYGVPTLSATVDFGTGGTPEELAIWSGVPASGVLVPLIPGLRMSFQGTSIHGADISVAFSGPLPLDTSAGTATLAFPSAAKLSSPADGAVGVEVSTSFAWQTSTVARFTAKPARPNSPSYSVVTAARSCSLPDTSLLGAPLPGAASYVWQVETFPGAPSTDSYADPAFVPTVNSSALTGSRTFVTR